MSTHTFPNPSCFDVVKHACVSDNLILQSIAFICAIGIIAGGVALITWLGHWVMFGVLGAKPVQVAGDLFFSFIIGAFVVFLVLAVIAGVVGLIACIVDYYRKKRQELIDQSSQSSQVETVIPGEAV